MSSARSSPCRRHARGHDLHRRAGRGDTVCLRFKARVDDRELEGIDFLELDPDGRVAELTVFMRPLSAITAFNEQMKARLEAVASPPATTTLGPLESPADNPGGVSEWLKEMRCKRIGSAYAGSNPASPTICDLRLFFSSEWPRWADLELRVLRSAEGDGALSLDLRRGDEPAAPVGNDDE